MSSLIAEAHFLNLQVQIYAHFLNFQNFLKKFYELLQHFFRYR